jgi:hypothetical protein
MKNSAGVFTVSVRVHCARCLDAKSSSSRFIAISMK